MNIKINNPPVYSAYNFDYTRILYYPVIEGGTEKTPVYFCGCVNCFDIESTNLPEIEQAVMYAWKIAIDEDYIISGRTWSDFSYFLNMVNRTVPDGMRIVIYVHNLSYEFNWLHGVADLENIFAVDKRKILSCTLYDKIDFRCSYLWSNMGLHTLTEKYNCKHKKLSGDDYNYNKRRFWFTDLTDEEEQYQINDVLGVVEALKTAMRLDGDTLATIPRTSTGYPRRDIRNAMEEKRAYLHWLLPKNYDLYKLLRASFRGGNTHANRYVVGDIRNDNKIVTLHNIKSSDMESCYPAVLVNEKFPCTPFEEIVHPNIDIIHDQINAGYAIDMHVTFYELKLRDIMYPCPYISYDRAQDIPLYETTYNGKVYHVEGAQCDNGRVLKADIISLAITDLDYKILQDQYTWTDADVHIAYRSKYKYLPTEFTDVVLKYFGDKTLLKGGDGEQAILYQKSKALLNALFGMCAMDAVKEEIIWGIIDDDELKHDFYTKSEQIIAQWERENPDADAADAHAAYIKIRESVFRGIFTEYLNPKSKKHGFLPYQWGVWCTAWARTYLQRGIDYVVSKTDYLNNCYFVYCDTDSIYYRDDNDLIDWDTFNVSVKNKSIKRGGTAKDKKGNVYYLGIFEQELGAYDKKKKKHIYAKDFKTMGAKKYAYVTNDGELKITIAGVGKKKGAEYLKTHGGLDALNDGFVFPAHGGGGTLAKYNDDIDKTITVDGYPVHIISNVYLADNFKTVGRAAEYRDLTNLLAMSEIYMNSIDKDIYI